ncbi:MAG: hypothetical protein IJW40_01705 [Clostridia bacterium]|nr:hypothetical protein [Clostridia bacterium]
MKKYTDPCAVQWDAWFVNRETEQGTRTHAFYLQNGPLTPSGDPREGWGVGHAVSCDGFHWESCPSVLPPLLDESNPADFHSKFTGCAVNRDDVCYLFYTMRDRERTSQRIGVAISRDWEHFEPWEGNPVVVNEDTVDIPVATADGAPRAGRLIGYNNLSHYDWNIVDARDFIVVEREDTDGKGCYSGYYAAAADLGGSCPVGVIVMLRSHDLLHWTDPRIVYHVDHHGVLEVPDVFYMDGKWVLCCLSGMNYSGRAVTSDPYASNATIVAYADSPDGPFLEIEEDNILIAGPTQSGFTCRSFMHRGERLLVYIDRADGKNALSLPKVLQMDGGRLRAHTCPIPEEHLGERLSTEVWCDEPNSFAWKTYGGVSTRDADGVLCLQTAPKDYHAVSIPLPEEIAAAGSAMVCAELCVQGSGGIFLRSRGCPYVVLLEAKEGRVALYRLYSFDPLAARKFAVENGKRYAVRCILIDGVIEVYVDDVLLLQCGLPTDRLSHLGFVADRGTLTAENIEIRGLL